MTLPKLKFAARAQVDPFLVMDVLAAANARAAAGADVIHMEVGEPGSGPPAAVLDTARRTIDTTPLGYTEALGRPQLRAAIARHYHHQYGLAVDPGQVVVTVGASGAFVLTFLAAFDPGDRVVVPEPAFPAYRNTARALGIEVVRLGLGPDCAFKPTVDQLEAIEGPIDGLLVGTPSNPTGTMLEPDELAAIARYCRARGIRLIVDEIYHGITYRQAASSVLAFDRDAIVINGFSKYFCMTGWRLGWLIAPPDLIRPIELLAQNLFISAPALAQEAGIAAFACRAELESRIAIYRRNRATLLDLLPPAGLTRFAPGRRRLLPVCRRQPPDRRFGRVVRRAARGYRAGTGARRRLRQRGRWQVRAPVLRRHGEPGHRRRHAAGQLAARTINPIRPVAGRPAAQGGRR